MQFLLLVPVIGVELDRESHPFFGGGLCEDRQQGREIDAGKVKPLLLFGLWRPFGRALVTVTSSTRQARLTANSTTTQLVPVVQAFYDTVRAQWDTVRSTRMITDSTTGVRDLRWTEIDGRFAWASSRIAVDARFGVRPRFAGVAAGTWGRVNTTVAVAPRLALVAATAPSATLIRNCVPAGASATPVRIAARVARTTPTGLPATSPNSTPQVIGEPTASRSPSAEISMPMLAKANTGTMT